MHQQPLAYHLSFTYHKPVIRDELIEVVILVTHPIRGVTSDKLN
jgi:hypothetical protein